MEKLLIIDGSSLLVSNYYGTLPNEVQFAKTDEEKEANFNKIAQRNGEYINAIYPTIRQILDYSINLNVKYLAVCFDKGRSTTFRKDMYEEYKENRKKSPSPLKRQFMLCEQILQDIGVPVFFHEKYEADDIAGSISKQINDSDLEKIILSKDKDYLQLVDNSSTVWMMTFSKDKANTILERNKLTKKDGYTNYLPEKVIPYTPSVVLNEKGVESEFFYEVLGLAGDTVDNIPGVKGVSEETAEKLIGHYKTIDALYEDIKTKDEAELKELYKTLNIKRSPYKALKEQENEARLSSSLAKIKTDIDLNVLIPFFSKSNLLISDYIKEKVDLKAHISKEELWEKVNNEIDKFTFKQPENDKEL